MTPADGSLSNDSIARIDELVHRVEALPDPDARASAVELVQAVMRLHADALERVLALAPDSVPALAADDLVSSVLALHGIHPDDFEARFARAIEKARRVFESRGAQIEVLEATPDQARVRLTGMRAGSAAARVAIENVIFEAAPEIGALLIEGAEEREEGFVPLTALLATQSG